MTIATIAASHLPSTLESPPDRRSAADRGPLHNDESRAFKMFDKPLRDDLRHDLVGLWTRLRP
jgi:hypothetical protein